jgi:hypothetical protein
VLITAAAAGLLAVVFVVAIVGKVRPAGFAAYREAVVALWPGRLDAAVARSLAVVFLGGEILVVLGLPLAATGPGLPAAVPFGLAA